MSMIEGDRDTPNFREILKYVKDKKKVEAEENNTEKKIITGELKASEIVIAESAILDKDGMNKVLAYASEDYNNLSFTREEILKASKKLQAQTFGVVTSLPLRCNGDMCPFKMSCVYYEMGKAPVGQPCLVEAQLSQYWLNKYIEEYSVDPNSQTEMSLVNELVEIAIYDLRMTKLLAEEQPDLMTVEISTVTQRGDFVENKAVSKYFDIKERLKKQKHRVLEMLLGTRRDKAKFLTKERKGVGKSGRIIEIKEKINQLQSQISQIPQVAEKDEKQE